W
ncbi:hypothetical protein V3C99_005951, partial [Haemonchus contortus]